VQVFDQAGRLLLAFGSSGDGAGQFAGPSGVAIDADRRIYVADALNGQVEVFQYLGETRDE
jgi:DNA-binding beta-propeller fold protein YncE